MGKFHDERHEEHMRLIPTLEGVVGMLRNPEGTGVGYPAAVVCHRGAAVALPGRATPEAPRSEKQPRQEAEHP